MLPADLQVALPWAARATFLHPYQIGKHSFKSHPPNRKQGTLARVRRTWKPCASLAATEHGTAAVENSAEFLKKRKNRITTGASNPPRGPGQENSEQGLKEKFARLFRERYYSQEPGGSSHPSASRWKNG